MECGWIICLFSPLLLKCVVLNQVSSLLSGRRVCRGLERLNSHEESPLLLSCDFSPNGIRELCTLQSSSSENIGNTKLLWTEPAWCNMFVDGFSGRETEARQKRGEKGRVLSGILRAWHWVRARKESVDATGNLFMLHYLITWVLDITND